MSAGWIIALAAIAWLFLGALAWAAACLTDQHRAK